ncbi:hypothetical protein MUK42_36177 [Musa troglodytarum]|uniref:C2H2-type domain-containing protein n=1 Tax=Musa troglodytarum TaxID=320322 RepID=A0A9E7EC31_9LILI|nr:hypothetical protein MUK42_36177 [Musa troglodytarum]
MASRSSSASSSSSETVATEESSAAPTSGLHPNPQGLSPRVPGVGVGGSSSAVQECEAHAESSFPRRPKRRVDGDAEAGRSSSEERIEEAARSLMRLAYPSPSRSEAEDDGQPPAASSDRQKRVRADANAADRVARHFQCPHCDRVFLSGQAFGGHVRIHRPLSAACSIAGSPAAAAPPPPRSVSSFASSHGRIDLNLPSKQPSSSSSSSVNRSCGSPAAVPVRVRTETRVNKERTG